jgi:hypothetical protein
VVNKRLVTHYGDRIQVTSLADGDIRVYLDEQSQDRVIDFDLTLEDSAALRRALFNAEWNLA